MAHLVTVTPNTTMDQTLVVAPLTIDKTNRAVQTVQSMAGKPTDAAWILGKIGVPSVALGFSAGVVGELVKKMLREHGVGNDFITVGGETRINVILIDPENHTHTTITTSTLEVEPEHIDALKYKLDVELNDAKVLITGGSLPQDVPPEFYTDIIGMARERGIPVIFDADEPNLSAGLKASPTYIKPNRDELSRLLGKRVDTLETAYEAGREIYETYGTSAIITLGAEGSLAVLADKAYRVPPLKVDVVSPAGAGDGMLAGLALSVLRGWPIEEGLRHGTAFATAVLKQLGTAMYDVADYETFLGRVEIEEYR